MSEQKEKVTFPVKIDRSNHARFLAANTNANLNRNKEDRTSLHDFIIECALIGLKIKEDETPKDDGTVRLASEKL